MSNFSLTKAKQYRLVPIIIGILLLGLFIYMIVNILNRSTIQKQTQIEYKPTIPPYTGKKLPQASGFDEELAKIKNFLPYKGQNYVIEYLQANIILVKISADTKNSYSKAKQDAEEFFRSKGVNDLCILKISWLIQSDTLRKSLTPEEKFTSNCSK